MRRPAGLLDNNVEFFVDDDLKALGLTNRQVIDFVDFPEEMLAAVDDKISEQPAKAAELDKMGITDRMERIHQYLVCNHGGFDLVPDMINGELQEPEYWACPKRGQCKHEGILCDGLKTDSGEYLSQREIEILRMVADGIQEAEIAERLFISPLTVAKHTSNIRNKTRRNSIAQLVNFVNQKILI